MIENKIWKLGIDPGVSGAIALVSTDPRDILRVWDMPNYEEVLTTGKKRKSVEVENLIRIFKFIQTMGASDNATIEVRLEKVQAYGKQSAPAAFNFGYAAALPYALSKAFSWPVEFISPVSWKRYYALQATQKDAARLKVLKHFPHHSDLFKRKMDVDRADAVLIAFYKERTL